MTGDSRLSAQQARLHIDELLKDAEQYRRAAIVARRPRRSMLRLLAFRIRSRRSALTAADRTVLEVRIRYAGPGDDTAVVQLAALDSAEVPEQPLLIAEVDGQVLVAMSLWDGRVVADPFRRTQALVELLAVRAGQIHSAAGALKELEEPSPRWSRRSEPGSERA
jgi:hypothetical protein